MLGFPYWVNIAPMQWLYIYYWANEQTALGLCWVPMLAHHCCQYGPILDQYWLAGWGMCTPSWVVILEEELEDEYQLCGPMSTTSYKLHVTCGEMLLK